MTDEPTPLAELLTPGVPVAPPTDLRLPADPGGAHIKGFSADPRPAADVPEEGPIPLAPEPDRDTAIHAPERDRHVHPTGRAEPRGYGPNDRLMGSDR